MSRVAVAAWYTAFALVAGQQRHAATTDSTGNFINPNSGGTYLETFWLRRFARTESENYRGTLAYEKNAGRWGHHRMAGLAQHQGRLEAVARTPGEVQRGWHGQAPDEGLGPAAKRRLRPPRPLLGSRHGSGPC